MYKRLQNIDIIKIIRIFFHHCQKNIKTVPIGFNTKEVIRIYLYFNIYYNCVFEITCNSIWKEMQLYRKPIGYNDY